MKKFNKLRVILILLLSAHSFKESSPLLSHLVLKCFPNLESSSSRSLGLRFIDLFDFLNASGLISGIAPVVSGNTTARLKIVPMSAKIKRGSAPRKPGNVKMGNIKVMYGE